MILLSMRCSITCADQPAVREMTNSGVNIAVGTPIMRNVLMDYVKPVGVRLALQGLVIALLIAYVGWTIQVIWFPGAM